MISHLRSRTLEDYARDVEHELAMRYGHRDTRSESDLEWLERRHYFDFDSTAPLLPAVVPEGTDAPVALTPAAGATCPTPDSLEQ